MKNLNLILPVILIAMIFATSCSKEEETPEPVPTPTPTPSVTTTTNNFVTGSGWNGQDTGLELRDANNDVIFIGSIYSPPPAGPGTYIVLNLDETYNYKLMVGSPQVNYLGTMTISSSGLSYFNSPASALEIYYVPGELTFWKQ